MVLTQQPEAVVLQSGRSGKCLRSTLLQRANVPVAQSSSVEQRIEDLAGYAKGCRLSGDNLNEQK